MLKKQSGALLPSTIDAHVAFDVIEQALALASGLGHA